MLHGKKGFERIVWAFKNVLNHSLAWLFCDLDPASQDNGIELPTLICDWTNRRNANGNLLTENRPIRKFQPQLLESSPVQTKLGGILTPSLQEVVSNDMQERECQDQYGALEEWIAMVQLGSPRVSSGDSIDPYLSRYSVPELGGTDTVDLISLKWHGFISSTWIMQLFLSLL